MAIGNKQIGWSQQSNLLWEISRQLDRINSFMCTGDCPTTTTTTTATPTSLRLTFNNIENANILVGDASNVNDWNAFFDLPTSGALFTSVIVNGNEVQLYGGSSITLRVSIFSNNDSLISIIDELGCIVSADGYSFASNPVITTINLPELTYLGSDSFASNCPSLINVNLPKITSLESSCFEECSSLTSVYFPLVVSGNSQNWFSTCTSLTTIDLPLITNVGPFTMDNCLALTTINLPSCTDLGGTVGDNSVFSNINGNTITLTISASLMTCNSGLPDGDIQYLQANNTVTVITV